jgi:phenylacetate-coenzyme A ligase PaaK-like adenylate-forming protein
MCTRLNAFQPDIVLSYPSVCGQLAHEQMEGVLRISPRHVVTSGELRSTRMSDDIRTAWDTPARDLYAMTEVGVVAGECREAGGLHHFNDLSIIEIVDDRGRPVPTGEQGARILVTNLFMRTQPLIRYEVSDMLTMDGNNCSCGRAWPLIRSISGRLDDLLWFRERDGREIQVHPLQLQSLILGQSWVRGYQICQEPERLLIRIVANSGRNLETRLESLREQVQRKLQELRVLPPPVEVMSVSAIPPENGPGGKVKLVKSYRCP